MKMIVDFLPLFGVLALGYVFWKNAWVSKQEEGTEKMSRIAKNIADGAMSFLKAEYKILSVFVLAVAILLYFKGSSEEGSNGMVAVSFSVGAICSALAGFIGMRVATKANVRTTNAARKSLGAALEVAFAGGAVMGLGVVGLGVLYYLKHSKPKFSDTNFLMYAGAMIFIYYLYKNQVSKDTSESLTSNPVTVSGLPPFK